MNELNAIHGLDALWQCLAIAIASASIAMTVTQTEIFAPWRAFAGKLHAMLGHLFSCFYCFSHWVVIGGVTLYRPVILDSGNSLANWLVSVFFTITLTAFVCGLMFKVFLAAMATHEKQQSIKQAAQQSLTESSQVRPT